MQFEEPFKTMQPATRYRGGSIKKPLFHTLSQTFLPASTVCIMIGKRESERVALSVNRSESWVRAGKETLNGGRERSFPLVPTPNFTFSPWRSIRAAEACVKLLHSLFIDFLSNAANFLCVLASFPPAQLK